MEIHVSRFDYSHGCNIKDGVGVLNVVGLEFLKLVVETVEFVPGEEWNREGDLSHLP